MRKSRLAEVPAVRKPLTSMVVPGVDAAVQADVDMQAAGAAYNAAQ